MTLLGTDLTPHAPSRRTFEWWKVREPALAGHDDFDSLVAEVRDPATTLEREDARLAALVRLAKIDNTALMALIIVLMPRLRDKVRRYGVSLDPADAEAELVTALIARVRRYDLQRRPAKLAVNLVWDATRPLRRARDRNKAWLAATVRLNGADTAIPGPATQGGGVELSEDAILDLAVTAGVVTATDAALVAATKLRGLSLADAAQLLGLGYEAAKKRRQRAQAALAAHYLTDPAGTSW